MKCILGTCCAPCASLAQCGAAFALKMASRPSGYVVHLADNRVIANLIAKNLIYVAARDGGGSTALVRANDEPIRAALTADATGLT